MSKSRKHIGRRKTSKQKTFKFEIRGFTLTMKGLDSKIASFKAFRRFNKFHTSKLSNLEEGINYVLKTIKKLGKPQTDEQKEILKGKRESAEFLRSNPPSLGELKMIW